MTAYYVQPMPSIEYAKRTDPKPSELIEPFYTHLPGHDIADLRAPNEV